MENPLVPQGFIRTAAEIKILLVLVSNAKRRIAIFKFAKYVFHNYHANRRVCVWGFIEDYPVTSSSYSCFRTAVVAILNFGHHWWKYYNFTACS